MAALIKEKDSCSGSLVDIWCVIDFMEKVGTRTPWKKDSDLKMGSDWKDGEDEERNTAGSRNLVEFLESKMEQVEQVLNHG